MLIPSSLLNAGETKKRPLRRLIARPRELELLRLNATAADSFWSSLFIEPLSLRLLRQANHPGATRLKTAGEPPDQIAKLASHRWRRGSPSPPTPRKLPTPIDAARAALIRNSRADAAAGRSCDVWLPLRDLLHTGGMLWRISPGPLSEHPADRLRSPCQPRLVAKPPADVICESAMCCSRIFTVRLHTGRDLGIFWRFAAPEHG